MKKVLKWIGIGIVTLIVIGVVFGNNDSTTPQGNDKEMQNYEILDRQENNTVENIFVLINEGKSDPKSIAEEVHTTCGKPCNISLYDDKKAYELDKSYNNLISNQASIDELNKWKQENYIYVADHLVGFQEFSTNAYDDYPYHDSFYEELKNN